MEGSWLRYMMEFRSVQSAMEMAYGDSDRRFRAASCIPPYGVLPMEDGSGMTHAVY